MSISEISAVSPLPLRRSARISAIAARALGPGAVRMDWSSSSLSPLMTGTVGATAADILALMDLARERVQAHFGVALEPEIRIIGE